MPQGEAAHEAEPSLARWPASFTSPSRWGQVEMPHEQNLSRSQPGRAGRPPRPATWQPGPRPSRQPGGAVGSAVWATITQAGPYQDNDAPVLERYCQLHDDRAVLLALVDTEGYVVAGSKQQPTAHPAIRLAHDIEAQMTQLESVLALNPEAHARLGLATA